MTIPRSIFISAMVCVLATLCFGAVLARALWYVPEAEAPMPASQTLSASEGLSPTRLIMPSVNIDAAIQKVGITFKGNVGTPTNYTDAGWYKYGTAPGDLGSAIIDGHVDNGLSMPGVFSKLKDVRMGDPISIFRSDGTEMHFIVTDIHVYGYKEVPMKDLLSPSGRAYVHFITCEGDWLPEAGTDDKRLVVTAIRVPDGV